MKYLQDYKGKHFVLGDRPDEMFGDQGTIEDDKITDQFLEDHVDACRYYGIPAYIGKDLELKKRINKIYESASRSEDNNDK